MRNVRVYNDFDLLPPAYEELFVGAGIQNGFFLSLPWYRNLWQSSIGVNGVLRVYGVEAAASSATARLALLMCHPARTAIWQPRRLEGLANCYTSLFGPLIRRSEAGPRDDLQLLMAAISNEKPRWDIIELRPMDKDTQLFEEVRGALCKAGMVVQPFFCFGNWYLEVDGRTFADYFSALPSKLRNTIIRKRAQLEKSEAMRIRLFTEEEDLAEGIEAYEAVYRASWKLPEPNADFIPSLMQMCARQGWLRLGVAYINNQAAAAQIWIVCNGVASIYKLAYDEKFAKLSIGSVLTATLMQHVIDIDQVKQVDYLTGDEPYKSDWMSHRRERWGIVAFNPRTIRGAFAATYHMGRHALKTLLKSPIAYARAAME